LLVFFSSVSNSLAVTLDAGYQLPQFSHKIVPEFLNSEVSLKQVLPRLSQSIKNSQLDQRVLVKKVRIKGNTVLTRSALLPIIKDYVGSTITNSQLHQMAFEITQLYIENGYINSGVVLPDQKIENGTVIFLAIEGKLGNVYVNGNKSLGDSYFANQVQEKNSPLNLKNLKKRLNEIKNNPLIESVRAEVLPGKKPGLAELKIDVVEKKGYQLTTGVDNYRSPGIGAERIYLSAKHSNITGHSDLLSGQVGITQGLKDYSLKYMFPINLISSKLSAYYVNSDAQIIEDDPELKIESELSLIGFNWLLDQRWNGKTTSSYVAGYEQLISKTLIDGDSSASGCGESGECESNILIISALWDKKTNNSRQHTNFTVRKGLSSQESNKLTSTGNPNTAAFYTHWQITQSLSRSLGMFRLNSKLQYAMDSLVGSEKFSLGGVATVRGYRENSVVRDNGFLFSSEWIQKTPFNGTFITAFVDYGVGWNKEINTDKDHLLSMGGGVAWQKMKSINTELFVGIPLLQRPDEFKNLQDFGIHFSLLYHII